MNTNFLIKTAEFAKICNTTKETLFYYDEINLLKPVYISEKGYRYYTLTQSDQFYAIRDLKNLGVSLQEIKEMTKNASPEQHFCFIDKMQNKIQEKQKILKQTHITLMYFKEDLNNYLLKKTNYIDEIPSSFICKIKSNKKNDAMEYVHKFLEVGQIAPKFVLDSPFYAGVIRNTQEPLKTFLYEYYYFRQPKSCYKKNFKKQKCLISFHDEKYETITESYKKLFSYAKQNHIPLTNEMYEEILYSPLSSNQNTFVIKIMARIRE